MTPLAPHLTRFLQEYLPRERRMSTATIETYAHAFIMAKSRAPSSEIGKGDRGLGAHVSKESISV